MEFSNESLGRRIVRLRLAHGMTQEHLAGLMNVSPQAVSKWENDQSAPDISLLVPLAGTLGISVDELLGVQAAQAWPTGPAEPETAPLAIAPESAGGAFEDPLEGDGFPEYEPASRPTRLRVQITAVGGDKEKVNVCVPFGALRALSGLTGILPVQIGGVLEGLDMAELMSDANSAGTLVDVDDGEDHVLITLE